MSQPVRRALLFHMVQLSTTLAAIIGSTLYLRQGLLHNYEESEARMDELEGTLRGHIGLIEDSLDRIEGGSKARDRGGGKMDELYAKRGKDEK
ncbi:MAG: hypothetical protein M1838_005920 [Thelocarpon superellum]|nr:MAG: hypothetical protein M1838_005920 [Thelocarpon superellum]